MLETLRGVRLFYAIVDFGTATPTACLFQNPASRTHYVKRVRRWHSGYVLGVGRVRFK